MSFNNSNKNAWECHLITIGWKIDWGKNPNDQKSSTEKLSWLLLVPRCQAPLHPIAKESCSTRYFWKLYLWLLLFLNLESTCTATERGSQVPAFSLCPHGAAQQVPGRKGNSTYKEVRLRWWHGLSSFIHL